MEEERQQPHDKFTAGLVALSTKQPNPRYWSTRFILLDHIACVVLPVLHC